MTEAQRRPVLIVEDHRSIREGLETLLLAKGYPVLTASTGEDALKLLEDNRPSVLLLDVMLPGMNGEQLLTTVRQDQRLADMSVIVVSAAPVTFGNVAAVIRKPPNIDRLMDTVQRFYAPV